MWLVKVHNSFNLDDNRVVVAVRTPDNAFPQMFLVCHDFLLFLSLTVLLFTYFLLLCLKNVSFGHRGPPPIFCVATGSHTQENKSHIQTHCSLTSSVHPIIFIMQLFELAEQSQGNSGWDVFCGITNCNTMQSYHSIKIPIWWTLWQRWFDASTGSHDEPSMKCIVGFLFLHVCPDKVFLIVWQVPWNWKTNLQETNLQMVARSINSCSMIMSALEGMLHPSTVHVMRVLLIATFLTLTAVAVTASLMTSLLIQAAMNHIRHYQRLNVNLASWEMKKTWHFNRTLSCVPEM